MKIVLSKPLPRCWRNHPHAKGILLESDVSVSNHSRLRAKLLVFSTRKHIRDFWNLVLDSRLETSCCGAVNGLGTEKTSFANGLQSKPVMHVDPRYFCIIALAVRDLCFEVVCHESIHAGFAYAKRTNKRNLWAKALDFDEEHVCYPAGRIASAINRLLFKHRLYEKSCRIERK